MLKHAHFKPVLFLLLLAFAAQTGWNPDGIAQVRKNPEMTMIKINMDAYLNGVTSRKNAPYKEIQRKILGLYDNTDADYGFTFNDIQLHAALPLNYLGYVIEPLNLRYNTLPDDETMADYDAIITWFKKPSIPNAMSYLIWVEKQVAKSKKLIVLGYTGLEVDERTGDGFPNDLKARLLRLIGLEYRGFNREATPKVSLDWMDSNHMEFERKYDRYPGVYAWIVPMENKQVKSWLKIKHQDFPNETSSVVTTSPAGAYAMQGYALWEEPNSDDPRYQWYINPFDFFEQVLGDRQVPMPDPTTVDGKRVFFSHVDGDSFHSLSQVKRGQYSSEILYDFFSNKISDIPLGVSFVVAEIDPKANQQEKSYNPDASGNKNSDGSPATIRGHLGKEKLLEVAQKIARLPNIELASHTYHHPYIWRGNKRTSAYQKEPFDLDFEIRGSIDFINRYIAPPEKKVKILFWTGDTTPNPEAFALLEELNLENLNGGDSVFDDHFNSVAHVSPFARKTGKFWQIFTCQSNENLYTDLWKRDFSGLENVIETYKKTDSPRRLQCANLYYHFYSGDRIASMKALDVVYQWIKKQNYKPVFPSEYIAMVRGFLSARVFRLDEKRFVVANRGKLNTFRLDQGKIDLERSFGVTASFKINNSLYLSLDPAVQYPVIQVD